MRIFKCLLVCLCLGRLATAQISDPVTPDNAIIIAQEIVDYYQNLPGFNLTVGEIKTFFDNQFSTLGYDANCLAPESEITDMDDTSISMEWTATPSTIGYLVAYQSLETITNTGILGTATNSIVLNNLPNELYLITTRSKCNTSYGALDIIIADKPVMLVSVVNGCKCLHGQEVIINASSGNGDEIPVFANWGTINQEEDIYIVRTRYSIEENDGSNDIWYSNYIMSVDFDSDDIPTTVYIAESCSLNVSVDQDANVLQSEYQDGGGNTGLFDEYVGYYAFNDELMFDPSQFVAASFGSPNQFSWNFRVRKCLFNAHRTREENNNPVSELSISALPNPSRYSTSINYQLPEQSNINVIIYNELGQIVQVFEALNQSAGSHSINVKWRDLPSGNYICRLQTKTDSKIIRLSKN